MSADEEPIGDNEDEPIDIELDPLAGLAEKTAEDPGAPFAPDVIRGLLDLKRNDRAAFEALRAQLKRHGCRVGALDEALSEEISGGLSARTQKQADILLRLSQSADLFHSPDSTGYADLDINGHRETWPIRSKGFTRWLARAFFEETNGAPGSEALQSALNVIDAKANFDSIERTVHVRVASHEGKLYLDRCDSDWSAIEIDTTGWRIVAEPPVRFRRSSGALGLPAPERGGSIDELKPFLNVRHVRDFVLVVAWTLAALIDSGPYPVLAFAGEQGTAKSTASKILRALIDPNTAPLRALPRNDRELFISANNAHLLVFDNVSGLPPWLSDTMCRLSSGGGFSVRSLYTNNDEVLFDAARPQILNGIGDVITRPDLADRALFITLKPIPEKKRRSDRELLAAFEAKRAGILGALLDALVVGLRRLPTTQLPELPRMADFAVWATACEQAFWKEGTFMNAYDENLIEVVDTVIEADLVGSAVRQMAMPWAGTASRLLSLLRENAEEGETRSRDWPNSPEALSNRLRRAATFLRKAGVEVTFDRKGRQSTRTILIKACEQPSAPSEPSATPSVSMTWRQTVRTGLVQHRTAPISHPPMISMTWMQTVQAALVLSAGKQPSAGVLRKIRAQTVQTVQTVPHPYRRGEK
ncbi:MAG TPA: hypothetical protein VFE60_10880 [Roseiarcus sp.]|jgi:hypothetical protein|nr:hypothetical protein [Roseiarcus sp.]